MTSIRRTLLLNVVLLLALTLGVVSYFVHRAAEGALRERQQTARESVLARYNDRRDEEMRNRAELLARDVQQNFQAEKFWLRWQAAEAAGVLSPLPVLAPSGQVPLLASLATWVPSPISGGMNTRFATELTLIDDATYTHADYEFVQMNADWGASWKSPSLGTHTIPVDPGGPRREGDLVSWDDVTLPDGSTGRRVVLKAPVTRYARVGSFWRPRRDDRPSPSRAVTGVAAAARVPTPRGSGPTIFGPPPPGLEGFSLPNFYLVCAWDTSPANPRLAPLLRDRDDQLAAIDAETEAAVGSLRATLTWSMVGALGVAVLGGWIVVGVALFPLKRLSFAVSQISPKDFNLPIDPRTLPAEVNPVAARLSQSLVQLQAAFEREKRAAADISHELRTPLAALTTTIEVACRKPRTAEQYRQTLDECRGIARQMSQLVERMLMLAWLDAGADVVRPERVEVGELVGGVAAIGKPLAEVQGLSFRVNLAGPLTVHTDPDKLREVVMNLLHNAIEYNRPGGEVELTAAATPQGGVMVEVRDTGIGMSPEVQAKIFERFFRADPSRQATGVHAGLGLAIVKEYVDRLGGQLTVDSTAGRGSRFRVELPNAL